MKLSYPVSCPDASAKVMAWCEDYEEAFPYLKNVGYNGIELLVKNPDILDKKLLETVLEENKLKISAIGTTPMQKEDKLFLLDEVQENQEEAIRRLYGLIELGAYFQAPVLVGKYRGTVKDTMGCRLEDLAEILHKADIEAGKRGILLLIEPQNPTNINNLNSIKEAVSWIKENHFQNIKLLMDLFHMNITEDSICESLKMYSDYLGMIHMSDSERLVPGFGTIDMKNVLTTLDELGFDGYLSMEIKQNPDTKMVAELSAKSLKYLHEKE